MSSKTTQIEGVVSPYLMSEIARRNPKLNLPRDRRDAHREVYDAEDGDDRPGIKTRLEGEQATGAYSELYKEDFKNWALTKYGSFDKVNPACSGRSHCPSSCLCLIWWQSF